MGIEFGIVRQDNCAARRMRDHRADPHSGRVHQRANGDGTGWPVLLVNGERSRAKFLWAGWRLDTAHFKGAPAIAPVKSRD